MSSTAPTGSSAGRRMSASDKIRHETSLQDREALEYWGYLFNKDKTATNRLKALLRGLKNVINEQYEPSDNSDLTPTQLASFYRDVGGNYDRSKRSVVDSTHPRSSLCGARTAVRARSPSAYASSLFACNSTRAKASTTPATCVLKS